MHFCDINDIRGNVLLCFTLFYLIFYTFSFTCCFELFNCFVLDLSEPEEYIGYNWNAGGMWMGDAEVDVGIICVGRGCG